MTPYSLFHHKTPIFLRYGTLLALFSQHYLHEEFYDVAELLVQEHQVDVNAKDFDGMNCLLYLVWRYKGDLVMELIQLLVNNGFATILFPNHQKIKGSKLNC